MSKMFAWFFALCIAILVGLPTGAYAQATRTWVSGVGDDVNPCSRTAPCKTFAGAISKTAAGGEIDVLDPGGFGTVTITKSITIDGNGTFASVLASATNGINVNAGAADVVILRNLSINGAGTTLGLNGINFLAGARLIIENCTIENFTTAGINIHPSTSGARTFISQTTIKNATPGIVIDSTNAAGAISANVTDTSVTLAIGATALGFSALVPAGKPGAAMFLNRVNASMLNTGVIANGSGALIAMGNSVVFANGTGVNQLSGGSVQSFKNNEIFSNGVDGTPLSQIQLN